MIPFKSIDLFRSSTKYGKRWASRPRIRLFIQSSFLAKSA